MRIWGIIAVFFLIWPTVPCLAAENPIAEAIETADPSAQHTTPRFEGYLFLDIDGQPLPIQSDAEIETFLAGAEIVDTQRLPTGITNPLKLTLEADGIDAYAAFNDADISRRKVTEIINGQYHFSLDWNDSYRYSIAAYRLDRLLGLDRVPPVVPRQIKRDSGAVSIWLAKTVTETERSTRLKVDPPDERRWNQQRLIMQVFDNLVANRDSNLGNLLIDPNWRLWFIDCSRCFGTTKTLYYPLKTISQCERRLWQGLKSLKEKEIRESLAPHLGRTEIDALLTRRDKLV